MLANWLPAPAEEFSLFLRAYWPDPTVLDGAWEPPAADRRSRSRPGPVLGHRVPPSRAQPARRRRVTETATAPAASNAKPSSTHCPSGNPVYGSVPPPFGQGAGG